MLFLSCKSGKVISRTGLFQPIKWESLSLEFRVTVEQLDKYISSKIDRVKSVELKEDWVETQKDAEFGYLDHSSIAYHLE